MQATENKIQEQLLHLFPEEAAIPQEFKITQPLHQREYLVNGELRAWNGDVNTVKSPVYTRTGNALTQVELGSFPATGLDEAMESLEAAYKAYDNGRGEWPTMSVDERISHMERFVKGMVERRDTIVKLIMWEIGKSIADSRKEFDRTVEYIVNTIDELKRMDRESTRFIIEEGIIAQVRRAPLGVTLCMGPFNYPLNETFTIVIPALIMGNTILFKMPKHGALLHYPLLEVFRDCFPKGVVNTVYGKGEVVVGPMMNTGKISTLALIGSSRVADSLKKAHPKSNRLRAILSLDAKNMAIVLPDANMESTIKEVLLGSLSFNGQRCTALKIFFVHRSIAGAFVKRLGEEIAKLKLGMPWEADVKVTPVAEPNKPKYLADVIADAEAKGAKVTNENGGATVNSLVYPAVLYPVSKDMRVYREEQFGPLIPVIPFDDIEEPIAYMVDSDHGQQLSIFGTDTTEIARLVDPMVNLVCRVNINAQCQRGPDVFPFTGRKDSAEGTLSVHDALRSFSIRTLVATKDTAENKQILNDILDNHKSKFLSSHFIF